MARAISHKTKLGVTALAWVLGLAIFFPILWTVITSFKTEAEAIADPPSLFWFNWTTENYSTVLERSPYFRNLMNSVVISVGSTLLGLIIAVPAAWSMAFVPGKRTKDVLMWMLSTKMLPPVGVLIPIYLIFRNTGMLDSRIGLIIVLTLINLPIIVWMLYTYFKEIPGEILEAARMDGASLREEIEGGAADRVHRQLFLARGAVLREALCRLDHGHRADPHHGLVLSETTRPWPYIRSREVKWAISLSRRSRNHSAKCRSSRRSIWISTKASSWSSSARRAAVNPPCCG